MALSTPRRRVVLGTAHGIAAYAHDEEPKDNAYDHLVYVDVRGKNVHTGLKWHATEFARRWY